MSNATNIRYIAKLVLEGQIDEQRAIELAGIDNLLGLTYAMRDIERGVIVENEDHQQLMAKPPTPSNTKPTKTTFADLDDASQTGKANVPTLNAPHDTTNHSLVPPTKIKFADLDDATQIGKALRNEEHNPDEEAEDENASWDAATAMARGVTAPPSATKQPSDGYKGMMGTNPDAFQGSVQRNDARDALGNWATPEEVDQVIDATNQEQEKRLAAARAKFGLPANAPMRMTESLTQAKHPSGLSRKDLSNKKLMKRGL